MRTIATLFLLGCLAVGLAGAEEPKSDIKSLESRAVGAMRSINTAQVVYARTYPGQGFACSLDPLLVGPEGAKPAEEHAGLLDNSLKDDKARMYHFAVECKDKGRPAKAYQSSATPLEKGARAFCSDETGIIRWSADGKAETCLAKGEPIR